MLGVGKIDSRFPKYEGSELRWNGSRSLGVVVLELNFGVEAFGKYEVLPAIVPLEDELMLDRAIESGVPPLDSGLLAENECDILDFTGLR